MIKVLNNNEQVKLIYDGGLIEILYEYYLI